MQINKVNIEPMNIFWLLACQYAAAPPPANTRNPIVVRGFSGAQREQLHKWMSRYLKNMKTMSVDDPLAPPYFGECKRSFTISRKQGSDAAADGHDELDKHRRIHPANSKKAMHWTTTGWTTEPQD